MPKPKGPEKERLNLDLHPAVKEQLVQLRERSGADSMSEVVRRALALYDLLLTETKDRGSKLYVQPKEGEAQEIALIF